MFKALSVVDIYRQVCSCLFLDDQRVGSESLDLGLTILNLPLNRGKDVQFKFQWPIA